MCIRDRGNSQIIIDETRKILNCDKTSVFEVDQEKKELLLLISKDAKAIKLPWGQGIAGHVALTGETLNIVDAYAGNYLSLMCIYN